MEVCFVGAVGYRNTSRTVPLCYSITVTCYSERTTDILKEPNWTVPPLSSPADLNRTVRVRHHRSLSPWGADRIQKRINENNGRGNRMISSRTSPRPKYTACNFDLSDVRTASTRFLRPTRSSGTTTGCDQRPTETSSCGGERNGQWCRTKRPCT